MDDDEECPECGCQDVEVRPIIGRYDEARCVCEECGASWYLG